MYPGLVARSVSGSYLLWLDLHFIMELVGISARCGWLLNAKSLYTAIALRLSYLYYVWPRSDGSNALADAYTNLLVLSAGFFAYDVSQNRRFSLLLHHLATSAVLCYVLQGYSSDAAKGDLAVFILCGSVITEPIILLRRCLKRLNRYSSNVKRGLGWFFAVSFSVVRALWCMRIADYTLRPDRDLFITAVLVVIAVLNIYFSVRILCMAIKDLL